jgi:hypothetical protein
MKFVSLKSTGIEVFVNPANVYIVSPSPKGVIGVTALVSTMGTLFEVDGAPSEIREKLEGKDQSIF